MTTIGVPNAQAVAGRTSTTEAVTRSKRRTPWGWFVTTGWRHLIGLIVSVIAIFPLLYVISTSLSANGTLTGSNQLFASITFDNYVKLVTDPGRPFVRWWFNTLFVAGLTAILSVFLCALAAYAFSRLRFSGRRVGLGTVVITQMFPQFLGIVAIFLLLSTIGDAVPALGLNSLAGLIVVYLGGALGVNTFLMYGFFNTVPRELDESAKIDGASHAQIFFGIILRLVTPILVVIGLLSFIATLNEFLIASLVLTDPDKQTLAVGLYKFVSQKFSENWGVFTAGAILGAIPVVLLFQFLQKYIVGGLTAGAVKG
jgi:arabinogalactan oligomer/maltooligosaccharide transport system permease protein